MPEKFRSRVGLKTVFFFFRFFVDIFVYEFSQGDQLDGDKSLRECIQYLNRKVRRSWAMEKKNFRVAVLRLR